MVDEWNIEKYSKEIINAPTKYTKCQECREIKLCKYIPDPFEEEIYGDETPKWLCEECYLRLRDEI